MSSLQELRSTRLEQRELSNQLTEATASLSETAEKQEGFRAQLEAAQQAAADAQQQRDELTVQLKSTEDYAFSLKEELEAKHDEVSTAWVLDDLACAGTSPDGADTALELAQAHHMYHAGGFHSTVSGTWLSHQYSL